MFESWWTVGAQVCCGDWQAALYPWSHDKRTEQINWLRLAEKIRIGILITKLYSERQNSFQLQCKSWTTCQVGFIAQKLTCKDQYHIFGAHLLDYSCLELKTFPQVPVGQPCEIQKWSHHLEITDDDSPAFWDVWYHWNIDNLANHWADFKVIVSIY